MQTNARRHDSAVNWINRCGFRGIFMNINWGPNKDIGSLISTLYLSKFNLFFIVLLFM